MAVALVNSTNQNIGQSGTRITDAVVSVPASVANGHLLVAHITVCDDAAPTITPPDGWNLQVSSTFTGTTQGRKGWIYTRTASSEPSSYTWTFGSTTVPTCSMTAWSGAAGTVDVSAYPDKEGSNTLDSDISLTSTARGRVVRFVNWVDNQTSLTSVATAASGPTEIYDHAGSAGSPSQTNAIAAYYAASDVDAGSIASQTFTATPTSGTIAGGQAVTVVIHEAASNTNASAGHAAVTVTSNAPTASTKTVNAVIGPTVTANQATASTEPNAGHAAVTATANQPSLTRTFTVGSGGVTATANQPAASVRPNAGEVTATATANQPTVSTVPATNAPAGHASVTAAANNTAFTYAPAGHASVTATANAPTVDTDDTIGDAGHVSATATSNSPSVSVKPNAGTSTASVAANQATVVLGVNVQAGHAAATVTVQGVSFVLPGHVAVSATTYGATVNQNTVPPFRVATVRQELRRVKVAAETRRTVATS